MTLAFESRDLSSVTTDRASELASVLRASRATILDRWYANQFDSARLARYEVSPPSDEPSLRREYLEPLLHLLAAFLETGEVRYRAVYLDERLRYAPHRAAPDVRRAFFREVLADDEMAIARLLAPDDAPDFRAFWGDLHSALVEPVPGDGLTLLAVGDCLLNAVRVFLPQWCAADRIALDMRCLYFSAAMGRDLATDEVLRAVHTAHPNVVAFSFLTYDGIPPYSMLLREADHLSTAEIADRADAIVGVIDGFLARVCAETDATFLVHDASGLPLRGWRRRLSLLPPLSPNCEAAVSLLNAGIHRVVDGMSNAIVLEEASLARGVGLRECEAEIIPASIAHTANFHHARFGDVLAARYADVLRAYRDLHRTKVLLVDFDETLWRGIIGEGAVTQHIERQRVLRELKDAGLLLVALSKNDPGKIRWNEMLLTPDDFVLQKISWLPKVQGIREAAQELDLGLDSFVVVDDSPAEAALIRHALPMVRVLDSTLDSTWEALRLTLQFPNTRQTEEARRRTEIYRAQSARRQVRREALDYPDLLAKLGLRAAIGPARPKDLDRVTELAQRTNQFNTTTIRYTRKDLLEMLDSADSQIHVADLDDRHGSLGLVAVVVSSRRAGAVVIESFIMSCRAMGFGLEDAMLSYVLDEIAPRSSVIARFVPTDRNGPAAGLYESRGFRRVADGVWMLDATAVRPRVPSWITVVPRE